jgi:hypothetical protein
MMTSLDERYLLFRDQTQSLFKAYPQMEPLRHLIFKQLLVQKKGARKIKWLWFWGRRLWRQRKRQGTLTRSDILLIIEGKRSRESEKILPVWTACTKMGLKAQIVALNTNDHLPPDAYQVRGVFPSGVPEWARATWQELSTMFPSLCTKSAWRSYTISACYADGLLSLASNILGQVKPSVLLVGSNSQSGSVAFSTVARARGVYTVQLQHGVPQAFYTPVLEDLMFTWGESSNLILQRLGVPTSKLRAVGSPRHDNFQPVPNARALFCRSLNLPDRPTLVFFSNGNDLVRNGNAPIESATWLEEAAVAIPHVNIVAKLHPNEDGALYRQTPHVRVIKNELDLITILSAADVIASVCSTAMYEALLFGKPVWQFYADGWPPLEDNWKQGLAIRVASSKELIRRIYQWMDTPDSCERWSRLSQRVFINHGRAAAAAAEYLASLLQK